MERPTVLVLVLAGTLLTGSNVTFASAPSPDSAPGALPVAPPRPGFQTVLDDTGLVAVSVPQDWTVQTTPTTAGTLDATWTVPTIVAGPVQEPPACNECSGYFRPPSVTIKVSSYEPIGTEPADDCSGAEVVPYDDGRFVGRREIGGGCDADIERVVASMPDAITVDILFTYWSVEQGTTLTPERRQELQQLFDTILSSVEWTGVPYDEALSPSSLAPSSDAPLPSAASAVTLPPLAPAGDDEFISIWSYPNFQDVPQLGDEPVRGTGCGGRGGVGDTIPDGLWAGYLYPGADGTVELDLSCVYYGDAAEQIVAAGTATIVDDNPDFLVVNNSTRRRTLTDHVGYVLWGVADEQGVCTPQAGWGLEQLTPDIIAQANGSIAWVRVEDGAAWWAFYGCDTGFQQGG